MGHTEVEALLHRAALLLPHQGPLSTFVHHNTLEAIEELPFQDALAEAARWLGATVRLPEGELRAMLADGRIEEADLRAVFEADWLAPALPRWPGLPAPTELAWRVLREGIDGQHWRLRVFQVSEGGQDAVVAALGPARRAVLAEGARRCMAADAPGTLALLTGGRDPEAVARRLREQLGLPGPEAAVRACMDEDRTAEQLGFALLCGLARRGMAERPASPPPPDTTELERRVDEALLPLVAAFLDSGGLALAARDPGSLYDAGRRLIGTRRGLHRRVAPLLADTAPEALARALERLHPGDPAAQERALRRLLLDRPGWAGAVAWREHHVPGAPRLVEYAALRLVVLLGYAEQLALDPAQVLAPRVPPTPGPGRRADRVAQLLARAAVSPFEARDLAPAAWAGLEDLLELTDEGWRCRLLQEAREVQARRPWLHALRASVRAGQAASPAPAVQVLCCIDEREESLRRALEERGGPTVQTIGLAGFFGLTIRWRGVDDVEACARHPVNAASSHAVVERPTAPPAGARAAMGRLLGFLGRGTLGAVGGALAALVAGPVALALVLLRTLAPGAALRLDRAVERRVAPPPGALVTRGDGVATDDGLPLGFTVEEAADRVAGTLRLVGLADGLAPLVVVLGHGSTTRNNPHAAAYQCGACGGHPGDANARAFAALANDAAVRQALAARGVAVPPGTRFVAGFHDTTADAVTLWPPTGLPAAEVDGLRSLLDGAAAQAAHERSRRFLRLAHGATAAQALAHVRWRSTTLAEPRPEYGHGTNALLVVGDRRHTRGLFLDRRAFLHSYEPATDPDGDLLERLLGAAVPVCAGINLEYYFSRVDNQRFGCGTKLPHNLVGLHGVIDGTLGDLRTGLPWQTVEVHEPLRLLVVVIAPRQRVEAVLQRLTDVRRLVLGQWIWLAVVDEGRAWLRTRDGFVEERLPDLPLPAAASSLGWARGRRDALAPARIEGAP